MAQLKPLSMWQSILPGARVCWQLRLLVCGGVATLKCPKL